MKLYKAHVEFDFIVAAEDENAAFCAAVDNIENAVQDEMDSCVTGTDEITNIKDIPEEWLWCIPFCRVSDTYKVNDRTVEQILEDNKK